MRAAHAVGILAGLAATVLVACRVPSPPGGARRFDVARDTFAFVNQSHYEFATDPVSGARVWSRNDPPPSFALHCAVMSRATRQFFVQARFDPGAPAADEETYRRLVAAVLERDPRAVTPSTEPVVIPGYPDLRRFSAAHADTMKASLIGEWRSALPRGEWRMVFPFSPGGQARTADELLAQVRAGGLPVVHAVRYPELSLNHMLLVYDGDDSPDEIRLRAYDPNDATTPVTMVFDRAAGTFVYPARTYFAGGPVKVFEIYHGLLF